MEVMSRTSSALNELYGCETTEVSLQHLNIETRAFENSNLPLIYQNFDLRSEEQQNEPASPEKSCFEIFNQSEQNPDDPCQLDEFVEQYGSEFVGSEMLSEHSMPKFLSSNEVEEYLQTQDQTFSGKNEAASPKSVELHASVQESQESGICQTTTSANRLFSNAILQSQTAKLPILETVSKQSLFMMPSVRSPASEIASSLSELNLRRGENGVTRPYDILMTRPNDNLVTKPNETQTASSDGLFSTNFLANKQQAQKVGDKRKPSDGEDMDLQESEVTWMLFHQCLSV